MLDVSEIQTIDHDVMVVGAGGAGLRAAIECSAKQLNTGVISKSLLGKAHTVMAEGGMAAAMGNVDDRDNWKVHFADTMRGGQYVNNWRMAELHVRKRRRAFTNSKRGARCLIAPRKEKFRSAILVGIVTRVSRTSATARGSNSFAPCKITAFIRASAFTWNTRLCRC